MNSMVVRFPDGTREFRYPENVPGAGDLMWHRGEPFRVVSVNEDGGRVVVIVETTSQAIGDQLLSEEGGIHLDAIA
jgi:hypothetical protein